jgi:phytoene synthase
MRRCDDLSDEPGATVTAIEEWRADMREALAGRMPGDPVWPAFADTVARYRLPHRDFEDTLDGVASDLVRADFRTFDELYRYCYQVASVPGLSLVRIFGLEDAKGLRLAELCGVAFQLTNIIRDVREDARKGRVYLPREDLERFGVDPSGFGEGVESGRLRELLRFEADRARAYYRESRPLLEMVEPSCRPSLRALMDIYSELLAKIDARGYDVLGGRIRLSTARKLWIMLRALPG